MAALMGTGLGEEGRLGPRRRIRSEFLVAVLWGAVAEMGGEMRGVSAMGWTKGSVRASGMGEVRETRRVSGRIIAKEHKRRWATRRWKTVGSIALEC